LKKEGVTLAEYSMIQRYLSRLPENSRFYHGVLESLDLGLVLDALQVIGGGDPFHDRTGSPIQRYLSRLPENSRVFVDMNKTNVSLYDAIPGNCTIVEGISPANHLKSIKNETEIKGFQNAVVKDGVALTKFYHLAGETNGGRSPSYRDQRRREADSLTCGTTAIHHG